MMILSISIQLAATLVSIISSGMTALIRLQFTTLYLFVQLH